MMRLKMNKEEIMSKIWERRAIIVLLIAIFLIALGIRGHLLRYEYLFEFDAFYHARLIQDIIQFGHVQSPDPLVYYEMGGALPQKTTLYHFVSAAFYNILAFGQPFNKELLMWSIRIFSVIAGALIAILMYFLAKETFNSKKVGIITAFVTAVCPAFAYRTMAGAQGDNSFGFVWMVLGFFFFIKAVKTNTLEKKDLINIALGGIFFGLMVITWGMFILIPLILVVYVPFALLLIASKQEHNEIELRKNHAFVFFIKFVIALAILHIFDFFYGGRWIEEAFTWMGRPLHLDYLVTAGITFAGIIAVALISIFYVSHQKKEIKSLVGIAAIVLLYVSLMAILVVFITLPDMHDRTAISSMVGEESNGNQFFGTKYNALIVFPWIALAFFPLSIWLFKKQDSHTGIIFFVWTIITLFMAWYTLKFTFAFGLGIAIATAITSFLIFEVIKKFEIEKKTITKVMLASLIFLIILGVGASAKFFPDYVPFVDENPQFKEMSDWISKNVPEGTKFFNWWNEGHILAFLTEKKYSSDNRNQSLIANTTMAKFIVNTDTNFSYYTITTTDKDYNFNADYIILEKSYFGQMVNFAYYVPGKADYTDPTVLKYSQDYFDQRSCQISETTVSCNGISLNLNEYNSLPKTWTSNPTTFSGGAIPIFIYNYKGNLLIIGNAINNSNLAKVWFNSDETKKFYQEVFSNGEYKIFKLLK